MSIGLWTKYGSFHFWVVILWLLQFTLELITVYTRVQVDSSISRIEILKSKINPARKGKYSCKALCISRFEKKIVQFRPKFSDLYTSIYGNDYPKWWIHELILYVWLSIRLNNQIARHKTNWTHTKKLKVWEPLVLLDKKCFFSSKFFFVFARQKCCVLFDKKWCFYLDKNVACCSTKIVVLCLQDIPLNSCPLGNRRTTSRSRNLSSPMPVVEPLTIP